MIIYHQAGNWGVQSKLGSPIYLVSWLKGMNRWGCTCPDYEHRRAANGQDCKHIKALRSFIDTASNERLGELKDNEVVII